MAKINKKPPLKRVNRKGAPPVIEDASNNLTNLPARKSSVRKDLNFKVDPDFKKRFKNYATDQDMSMHDLFIKVFDYYVANH